jgi:predicted anti-sigma-YlaC factor YlaD
VRHVADGMLRRLDDEPLAIPDRVTDHLAGCERCRARRARIARDTESASRLLSAPQLVPDAGMAWGRVQRELHRTPEEETDRRRTPAAMFRRRRFPTVSLRAGLVMGAVGTVVAGTAAAATLTTIFAPTHVAPVSVSQSDLRAITALMGDNHVLGGFATPSGSRALRFGTIKWFSSGPAQPASSLAEATAEAGLTASLPAHLPAGVGAVQQFMVQPRVSATVTFNSRTPGLGGSSVTLHAGPAVLAQYAAAGRTDVPTLGVMTMPRPTARSTGATVSQVEAFLLVQPGIPSELAEEVRLLGDLRTTLPVPVPPGASVRSVRVAGWPGVLVADSSNAAAGVVWEDGRGMIHVVAGILDSQDVLNVADQLG